MSRLRNQKLAVRGSAVDKAERGSGMAARASGQVNLMLAKRSLSRAGLREAAAWSRQAADLLEESADGT